MAQEGTQDWHKKEKKKKKSLVEATAKERGREPVEGGHLGGLGLSPSALTRYRPVSKWT